MIARFVAVFVALTFFIAFGTAITVLVGLAMFNGWGPS